VSYLLEKSRYERLLSGLKSSRLNALVFGWLSLLRLFKRNEVPSGTAGKKD
jgi:hypothetical protein